MIVFASYLELKKAPNNVIEFPKMSNYEKFGDRFPSTYVRVVTVLLKKKSK